MLFVLLVLFVSSMQPIVMVVMLVFITLAYSLVMYELMSSYWVSYVLVLVMLSGILVVFTYMVSMIPNEGFEFKDVLMVFFFVFVVMSGLVELFKVDGEYMMMGLWGFVGLLNMFVVVYLLVMMVGVVWLSAMGGLAMRVS